MTLDDVNGPRRSIRLACLLTCHNRKEKTLTCLLALIKCNRPDGLELTIYVVDDGSTDGTAEAIEKHLPEVRIISGDGSLFWNGGMRVAFAAAMADQHDDYLWLNDDTTLLPDALNVLYSCRAGLSSDGGKVTDIVVGATCDPSTGALTYGGLVSRDEQSPNYLVPLPMRAFVQRCKTLNGNCVLISSRVALELGNLDERFVHAIGDWDYGFRANAAGHGVWMAPGFIGFCERNPPPNIPLHQARSIRAALKRICGPKQVPPRAWYTFVRRNYGMWWPLEFVKPYATAVLSAMREKVRYAVRSASKEIA